MFRRKPAPIPAEPVPPGQTSTPEPPPLAHEVVLATRAGLPRHADPDEVHQWLAPLHEVHP